MSRTETEQIAIVPHRTNRAWSCGNIVDAAVDDDSVAESDSWYDSDRGLIDANEITGVIAFDDADVADVAEDVDVDVVGGDEDSSAFALRGDVDASSCCCGGRGTT